MAVDLPDGSVRTGRVRGTHLSRKAIIYIRQSSPVQVERNRESTALQYGLKSRALQLGWADVSTQLIDDDLGASARRAGTRAGFANLVSEVFLGHVGIVISSEVSRLSRNYSEWGRLFDLCGDTDTLIADTESLYDLKLPNDRFLLGIKASVSEAELHTMRQRMHAGREAKAARGELKLPLSRGYVRDSAGALALDPDQSVQARIRGVFDTFARLGSMSATVRALAADGQGLPLRASFGPKRGRLAWVAPNTGTVHDILSNPVYAGAFAWGRQRNLARDSTIEERWRVLIRDRFPAYISWHDYELNQHILASNRWPTRGRNGGLLSGLLRCGRCGQGMTVAYRDSSGGDRRYSCRGLRGLGGDKCQSLSAAPLEAFVDEAVVRALAPEAMALSLEAQAQVEEDRAGQHEQWQLRLECANRDVLYAERDWRAVDPENRLVAQTLEGAWEAALANRERLQKQYRHFCARTPRELSEQERDDLLRAVNGIAALWGSGRLSKPEKAEILRLMIAQVSVTVIGTSERVKIELAWHGGSQIATEIKRPVRNLKQLSNWDALRDRVQTLKQAGYTTVAIADTLNHEGWRPARLATFTEGTIQSIFRHLQSSTSQRRHRPPPKDRASNEWLIEELSRELEISKHTLFGWVRKGWLTARKSRETGPVRWLIHADVATLEAIRRWRNRPSPRNTDPNPDFRTPVPKQPN